jgi:hypothetical protein
MLIEFGMLEGYSDLSVITRWCARECYTTPDFIRDMKAVEGSHADWVFYVSGMTGHAARVRVPYGIFDALPRQKRRVRLAPRRAQQANAVPAGPVEQRAEVLATIASRIVPDGPLIKPGKD